MEKSGIYSLAGFAYQIKVFIVELLHSSYDEMICFEAIDDVSISPTSMERGYVKNEDALAIYCPKAREPQCIQVKCTDLYDENFKRILINWLVLVDEYPDAKAFTIITDTETRIRSSIDCIDIDALYIQICSTKKKASSTIAKAKAIYANNEVLYKEKINYILKNYKQKTLFDIDLQIYEDSKTLFHYGAIEQDVYSLRVKELVEHLTGAILVKINKHEPFSANKVTLARIAEDICNRVNDNEYIPDFVTYKRIRKIELNDVKIMSSREYKQLQTCALDENRLVSHLLFKEYYADMRYRCLEYCRENDIEQIEETAYENFRTAKDSLVLRHEDSPLARLNETKKLGNAKTHDDQSKWGACIYLTRAEQPLETQISWSDDYE